MSATHLHFDGYSGLSGDMILGALVDLGVSVEQIEQGLRGLPIGPFSLRAERVKRAGLMGTRLHVQVDEQNESSHEHEHPHPHDHPHAHEHHHHEADKVVTHSHEHTPGHHEHTHEHSHEHDHQHDHEHKHDPDHTHEHSHEHHHHHSHRRLSDVYAIVEAAGLPPRALARAKEAYRRLAEAEAQVHGATIDTIHFHEVGAKDAIVDIAGAMLAIELLGAQTFSASPLTVGFGTVHCQHGEMPVPAPATAVLLRGMPTIPGRLEGEMVTPTGAAILATLLGGDGGRGFISGDRSNELISERLGYGAGARVYEGFANYLRLWLCRPLGSDVQDSLPIQRETILALECEIDDMTPEIAGWLVERLSREGAFDVHFEPIQMKKNRPAFGLRVLAPLDAEPRLAEAIFRETSTFGLRRRPVERWVLPRRKEEVQTSLGPVAVKIGIWGDHVLKVTPENESCAELARRHNLPLAEVYDRAHEAIRRAYGKSSE